MTRGPHGLGWWPRIRSGPRLWLTSGPRTWAAAPHVHDGRESLHPTPLTRGPSESFPVPPSVRGGRPTWAPCLPEEEEEKHMRERREKGRWGEARRGCRDDGKTEQPRRGSRHRHRRDPNARASRRLRSPPLTLASASAPASPPPAAATSAQRTSRATPRRRMRSGALA